MARLAAAAATLALLVATGTAAAPAEAQTAEGKYAQQAFAATNANRTHQGSGAGRTSA